MIFYAFSIFVLKFSKLFEIMLIFAYGSEYSYLKLSLIVGKKEKGKDQNDLKVYS